MGRWLAPLALAGLHSLGRGATGALRGVSPEDEARYACQGDACTFTCFTARPDAMPHSVVNDNFCDCPDGSDEPGTAACAGQNVTLFFCPNQGGVPRMVYTSRVDDGVCDCCDGSDELRPPGRFWGSGPPVCTNTCAEEGRKRAELLERLKSGIEKQKVVRKEAKNARQKWRTGIEALKSKLPALEKALEDAKTAQIPPAIAARFDDLMKIIGGLRTEIHDQRAEIQDLRARQDRLEAENARLRAVAADGGGGTEAVQPPPQTVETVPQVSEYTKWMDNSEEMLKSPGAGKDTKKAVEAANVAAGGGAQADVTSNSSQADPVQLQKDIDTNKQSTSDLEAKIAFWSDDRIGYFSLMDKCLEEKVGEFKYKICFFKDAHQGSTLAGTWSAWTGPRLAVFTEGSSCSGGIKREMSVKFQCGPEESIVTVTESKRCAYEAIVLAPGACGKRSKHAVEQANDPKPLHPKDEL